MKDAYVIDERNYLKYEIVDRFALIRVIFYDDVTKLETQIKTYIDNFIERDDVDVLGGYPGTYNPLVAQYFIDHFKTLGLSYRLFYDKADVPDAELFERTVLAARVAQALDVPQSSISQSTCEGLIGLTLSQRGFAKCGGFFSLRPGVTHVPTPVKYYRIDNDGYLVQEFDEKPADHGNYFQSMRIRELFQTKSIRMENGKPQYYARPVPPAANQNRS